MNVLLVAPQPFFRERGTPIAVRLLAETLGEAGHSVDLLVYHEGEDISAPGLTLHRIPSPPMVRDIPIGFSLKKLVCDFFLFFKTIQLVRRKRYDVIHAVEEAVFTSLAVNSFAGKKLVYDMDSLMADQLIEKWGLLRHLSRVLHAFEGYAVRKADMVLAVCDDLAERARLYAPGKPVFVIEDIPLSSEGERGSGEDLREACGAGGVLALYVGNLEPYQGIDLLLEAFARCRENGEISLVIVGGEEKDIEALRARAAGLGVGSAVHFIGPRPVARLQEYLRQADILVSPRLKGVNTPMKVYSYLSSGKAVLATDIKSHTQVLDSSCAVLVKPEAEDMALALRKLAGDPDLRRRLGGAGLELARTRYTREAYRNKVLDAYSSLEGTDRDSRGEGARSPRRES